MGNYLQAEGSSDLFILGHLRVDEKYVDDDKLIGIYSSFDLAEEAWIRIRMKPGFVGYPEGFYLHRYRINRDSWRDGFETLSL